MNKYVGLSGWQLLLQPEGSASARRAEAGAGRPHLRAREPQLGDRFYLRPREPRAPEDNRDVSS